MGLLPQPQEPPLSFRGGHPIIFIPPQKKKACIDESMEVVQFLVESGADVNQADNEGWTPLHVAASCGYRDIAQCVPVPFDPVPFDPIDLLTS